MKHLCLKRPLVLLSLLMVLVAAKNTTTGGENRTIENQESSSDFLAHEQQRLIAHLFENYDSNVRPVLDPGDNVTVIITPSLRQIVQINEKEQVLTLYCWLIMSWYDASLVWNKTEYRNISQINIEPSSVWLPDIALVNSAQEGQDALIYRKIKTKVQVFNDGRCLWLSPYFSSSSCPIDSTNFPFDEQTCIVEMASWTQSGLNIDVQLAPKSIETVSYLENIQWKLVSASAHRKVQYYASIEGPFPSLSFKIVVRRRSLFYIINLILPCVILSALSLMTFYIPAASGERVTLSISLLLTMLFTLYIVTENLPPDSTTVPLLTKFIGVAMLVMTLSLFATAVGIKFDEKAAIMPRWMSLMVNRYLARLVFYDTSWLRKLTRRCRCKRDAVLGQGSQEGKQETLLDQFEEQNPIIQLETRPVPESSNATCRHRITESLKGKNAQEDTTPCVVASGDGIMKDIANTFRYISSRVEKKCDEEELEEEWKKAGEVLNKLFFWSFFAVLLFATIAIFSNAQYTE